MNGALEITLLARLLETGQIKAGVRNQGLINRFRTARWIQPSTRNLTWNIRSEAKERVLQRLNELLPTWEKDFSLLRTMQRNPYEESDIEALPMLRRTEPLVRFMINRRNWKAAAGLGPKHAAKIPARAILTKDWILRFRPNAGLLGVTAGGNIDLSAQADFLDECLLPERAWMKIQGMAGTFPKLIISCENLGAYIDLPIEDSTLAVFAPGKDIEPAASLIKQFPEVPWVHFGDLDREGLDIAHKMASTLGRTVQTWMPSFADEYLDCARTVKTDWAMVPDMPVYAALKKGRKRIFQEIFMLDARLAEDLASLLRSCS